MSLTKEVLIMYSWENRQQYIDAIRQLRQTELENRGRMEALRAGLATVMPLQLLAVMGPADMEMRTCGLPTISIEFLKVSHTQIQDYILPPQ